MHDVKKSDEADCIDLIGFCQLHPEAPAKTGLIQGATTRASSLQDGIINPAGARQGSAFGGNVASCAWMKSGTALLRQRRLSTPRSRHLLGKPDQTV
jgi:hypothetical protein